MLSTCSRLFRRRQSSLQTKEKHESNSPTETSSSFRIVAAIDFGTTFTGFAFAFKEQEGNIYLSDHGNVFTDARVPTAILLNSDNSFKSFGTLAESDYIDSFTFEESNSFRFFNRFKMELYKADKVYRDKTLTDSRGQPMKAMEIFTIILKYLKEVIIGSINISFIGDKSSISKGLESEILWILTIPAIWSDSAKQFMREAAKDAGYPEDRLRLVLEPEAASMWCREMPIKLSLRDFTPLLPGSKYIIADLGGGTADICVHEVLGGGKIRELYRATGGDFGGTLVDREFQNFMIKIIGEHKWKDFTQNNVEDYFKLMKAFEDTKRKFDSNNKNYLIELRQSFLKLIEPDYKEIEEIKKEKLVCGGMQMERFFDPSVKAILQLLSDIVSDFKTDKIDALVLAGGFTGSPYIQRKIREYFENRGLKIILLKNPSLAVLKGAVMMGFHPSPIVERRARYTYGFAVAAPFKEGEHPEKHKFERNGEILCTHIFDKVIQKDAILKYKQIFRVTVNATLKSPESKKQNFASALYRSSSHDPKYCVEGECTKVGSVTIKAPNGGWSDYVTFEYNLIVGETELEIKVMDKQNGRFLTASFDFL